MTVMLHLWVTQNDHSRLISWNTRESAVWIVRCHNMYTWMGLSIEYVWSE